MRRLLSAAAVVAMVAAVGLVAVGGSSAAKRGGSADVTISMELKGKELFFKGPRSIDAGTNLTIESHTDPMEVGPHTFSLVKKQLIPDVDKKAIKGCFKDGICLQVAKAHEVDFEAETIGKNLVRSGKSGWDDSFGRRGDSWAALKDGSNLTQSVSAREGTTLYYMCLVHPEMQGKIKVR